MGAFGGVGVGGVPGGRNAPSTVHGRPKCRRVTKSTDGI